MAAAVILAIGQFPAPASLVQGAPCAFVPGATVPDGGTALILLGGAMTAMALIRAKVARRK
jgi:hypothetical protein